jgi:hypothetical protein
MSYIGKTPTVGNFQVCDAISVVNNQAAYTMQVSSVDVLPESANHMIVSLNGVIQKPNSSYTVSGATITFASNLVTGDVINFIQILGNVLDLGVPSDSTVSLAKLTATGTKNSTTFLRGDNTFAAAGSPSITDNGNATAITINSSEQVEFTDGTVSLPSITNSGDVNTGIFFPAADTIAFAEGGAEAMRIDSSGNLLVGTTSTTPATGTSSGNLISSLGRNQFSSNSDTLELNRHGSEGIILSLRKDGTRIGTINARSNFGVYEFGTQGTGIGGTSSHAWLPHVNNARSDNTTSLGQASYRMTVVYATTGTINTSDQNEKQSIQSLTTAEMNVGKKLSSLIKTYKWNSSVEEKGDSARTHTGIIAQDVQQAFNDEGLDASKYGLWCSDTWSIDADGERIENSEEVTENNSSKNKLGIRYEQLLSFIQAYNDQRFTELEARITQLENA